MSERRKTGRLDHVSPQRSLQEPAGKPQNSPCSRKKDASGLLFIALLGKAFGKFERQVASVIQQIGRTHALPPDADLSYLVNFITLLAVRHPAMRASMERAQQHGYRIILDMLASDEQLFRFELRRAYQDGFVASAEFSFDRFRKSVRHGSYKITIPREDHIERELKVFKNLLEDVGSRALVADHGSR